MNALDAEHKFTHVGFYRINRFITVKSVAVHWQTQIPQMFQRHHFKTENENDFHFPQHLSREADDIYWLVNNQTQSLILCSCVTLHFVLYLLLLKNFIYFSSLLHLKAKSRLFLWAKSPVCWLFKGITWEQLREEKAVRDAHLTLNQNMSVKHKCLALDENLIYQWNWMCKQCQVLLFWS